MGSVLAFLGGKLVGQIAAPIALLLMLTTGYQYVRIQQLKADVAESKLALTKLERDSESLKNELNGKADALTKSESEKAELALALERARGKVIIREVTKYVTPEIDRDYLVPNAAVRLFDAAASGSSPDRIPNASGQSDDAASAIRMSAFISMLANNFAICRENNVKLEGLQNWVRGQEQIR